jgi:hypothetical protein
MMGGLYRDFGGIQENHTIYIPLWTPFIAIRKKKKLKRHKTDAFLLTVSPRQREVEGKVGRKGLPDMAILLAFDL